VKQEEMSSTENQMGIVKPEPNEVYSSGQQDGVEEMNVSFPGPTIIAFDAQQAAVTPYPPGCPVMHVDNTKKEGPPVVTMGEVRSVSCNVTSKEFLYHVIRKRREGPAEAPIIATEAQLSFAPFCAVEAKIYDASGSTKKSAVVLTSYQPLPTSEALYSIQEDCPRGALFHGIPKQSIKYRPVATTTPSASTTQSVGVASNAAVGCAEVSRSQSTGAAQANTARKLAKPTVSPTHEEPPTAMNAAATSKDTKRPSIPIAAAKRSVDNCKEDNASDAPAAAESNERAQSPNSSVRLTDRLEGEILNPRTDHSQSPIDAASRFSYASLATSPSQQEPGSLFHGIPKVAVKYRPPVDGTSNAEPSTKVPIPDSRKNQPTQPPSSTETATARSEPSTAPAPPLAGKRPASIPINDKLFHPAAQQCNDQAVAAAAPDGTNEFDCEPSAKRARITDTTRYDDEMLRASEKAVVTPEDARYARPSNDEHSIVSQWRSMDRMERGRDSASKRSGKDTIHEFIIPNVVFDVDTIESECIAIPNGYFFDVHSSIH
jgi:hypothetical protein